MQDELKQKWIQALRNGEYSQVEGKLRATMPDGTFGFCCLGVLCDIQNPDGWFKTNAKTYFGGDREVVNFDFTSIGLPEPHQLTSTLECCISSDAISAYGLDVRIAVETDDEPRYPEAVTHLMDMNDSGKHSFDDISYWIEKNL